MALALYKSLCPAITHQLMAFLFSYKKVETLFQIKSLNYQKKRKKRCFWGKTLALALRKRQPHREPLHLHVLV